MKSKIKSKMKKGLSVLLCFLLIAVTLSGCSSTEQEITKTGTAQGYGGPVTVTVTMKGDKITNVTAIGEKETNGVGSKAIESIPAAMIKANSVEVDVVTGATFTSNAVLTAAKQAYNDATGKATPITPAKMKPGVYTVSAKGIDDNLVLSVTVDDTRITDIKVVEHNETKFVAQSAFDRLIPAIIEHQTVGIDTISGATATSNAIRTAVLKAVEEAGGNTDLFSASNEDTTEGKTIEKTVDVVIAGSGISGMSAAVAAGNEGASVLVVEKLAYIGGSAILSGGNTHGVGGPYEGVKGGKGDIDGLYKYWMNRAENNADPNMVHFMAENIASSAEWMINNGVTFTEPHKTMGRFDMPICLQVSEPGGIITPLYEKAIANGTEIMTDTEATELILENGKITGLKAKSGKDTLIVHAEAVVLATGGYNASAEMRAEYSPLIADTMQAGCPGNTGDGIKIGVAAGAATVFKPESSGINLQSVPGVSFNSPVKNLAYVNALGVTDLGVRYADETIDYSRHQRAMLDTERDLFYKIFDASTSKGLEEWLESAVKWEKAYTADSIEELAGLAGIPANTLKSTVARYNELCAAGNDTDFGKAAKSMIAVENGPYYAVMCVPACSGTVGGLKINLNAEVLNTEGTSIPGLYAAGEVCNGDFFGNDYPISGSIDFGMTFGRIAGTNAVNFGK